jgi:hippurate hydrolase
LAPQSIVARNIDPLPSGVLTISSFNGRNAANVVRQTAELTGIAR